MRKLRHGSSERNSLPRPHEFLFQSFPSPRFRRASKKRRSIMKFRRSSIGALVLFVLTSPAWSNTFSNGLVSAQTINKPSVQFFLQVHKGYKGDPETWSWTPMIDFRANGPFSPGSALSVEYSLPGKSWRFDCNPQDAGPSSAWVGVRDCGQNPPDTEAVTYTGPVDFKINLKNELEGKSATLFSGKFKVEKFHEGVVDLPKFKNNFVYYVNYDWTLPVAYIYDQLVYNWEYAYPIGNTTVPNLYDSRLIAAFWFKRATGGCGVPNVGYGKYKSYPYYQATTVP